MFPPLRIAVVRIGAIGDTILLFPLLAALKVRFPRAEILAIGRTEAWEVARRAQLCHRVVSPDAIAWWTRFDAARTPDPRLADALADIDWLIDFDSNADAARLQIGGTLRHDAFAPLPPAEFAAPAVSYYLNCLGFANAPNFIYINDNRTAIPPDAPFVLFPGAGSPRKRAPITIFTEHSRRLREKDSRIILATGEADDAAIVEFNENGGVFDEHWHRVPLTELAERLSNIRGFLANDSGVAHLAAFCGARGTVLFKDTAPRIWAPPSPIVRVIDLRKRGAHDVIVVD
ncbi:MAG: hypothetical protein HY286_17530 [Planctomycetes bacterium]|nr:hypothetical protein [Planctomycetota bacterium]